MSLGTNVSPDSAGREQSRKTGRGWRWGGGALLAAALILATGVAGAPPVGPGRNPTQTPSPPAPPPAPVGLPPHAPPASAPSVLLPAVPTYPAPLALPTVTADPREAEPAVFL